VGDAHLDAEELDVEEGVGGGEQRALGRVANEARALVDAGGARAPARRSVKRGLVAQADGLEEQGEGRAQHRLAHRVEVEAAGQAALQLVHARLVVHQRLFAADQRRSARLKMTRRSVGVAGGWPWNACLGRRVLALACAEPDVVHGHLVHGDGARLVAGDQRGAAQRLGDVQLLDQDVHLEQTAPDERQDAGHGDRQPVGQQADHDGDHVGQHHLQRADGVQALSAHQ